MSWRFSSLGSVLYFASCFWLLLACRSRFLLGASGRDKPGLRRGFVPIRKGGGRLMRLGAFLCLHRICPMLCVLVLVSCAPSAIDPEARADALRLAIAQALEVCAGADFDLCRAEVLHLGNLAAR